MNFTIKFVNNHENVLVYMVFLNIFLAILLPDVQRCNIPERISRNSVVLNTNKYAQKYNLHVKCKNILLTIHFFFFFSNNIKTTSKSYHKISNVLKYSLALHLK